MQIIDASGRDPPRLPVDNVLGVRAVRRIDAGPGGSLAQSLLLVSAALFQTHLLLR